MLSNMLATSIFSLLLISSVVSASDCTPGTRTVQGRTCRLSCSIDRPGGDYGQLKVNTWEGCVQACAIDPKCVTAQYHYQSGFCYKKSVRNGAVDANNQENTVDCDLLPANTTAPAQCKPERRIVGGRQCKTLCNVDRPGGDYGSLHTTTFEGCIQACGKDRNCVAATYDETNGFCYMKNSQKTAVTKNGQDTVDCDAVYYDCGPITSKCDYTLYCHYYDLYFCICTNTPDGPFCANTFVDHFQTCAKNSDCGNNEVCSLDTCYGPICVPIDTSCQNYASPKFMFARGQRLDLRGGTGKAGKVNVMVSPGH